MKNMFQARPFWTVLIAVMSMAFVITACSGAAAPTTVATTPPAVTLAPKPTATAPGGFPVGTYMPDHQLDIKSMLFTAAGTFVTEFGLDNGVTGHYAVSGDKIVFNQDDGVCFNHPGTYHWEIHGKTLLLKPIDDSCTESSRQEELGGRSWLLQP